MTVELPDTPYKGLAPFTDTDLDAMLFFGRERDVDIVCANAIASKLTVLYGPSGVGKSSLLAAAVCRRLRELPERPAVVLFSSWSEPPAEAIARALCIAAGIERAAGLAKAVEQATAARGETYLILDQLEEYFLYHPSAGALEAELGALVTGPSLCNIVLSLREDAVAKLDRFKAAIPGILDNYLRLDRLPRSSGRAAIERPLDRWHALGGPRVTIEPELTDAVLDEVAAGRICPGLGGSGRITADAGDEAVEAPYLQLVMERIWDVERGQGSDVLRAATLEQLGGAARIVADHLERAMEALTPAQQRIASDLLRQLVTPSGTKIAHAATDLAGYAAVPEDEMRGVLDRLVSRRILRPAGEDRYEIYHDVLVAPVLAWRARYANARELVEAHRRVRRLVAVAVASLAALAVMMLVAAFALVQRSNARADARAAHARELDAAAASVSETDPELGLVLARDAAVLSPTSTAEDVLRQALLRSRLRTVADLGTPLLAAAVAGDATVAAAADGTVTFARGSEVRTAGTRRPALAASISDRGEALLTGRDGLLRLVTHSGSRIVPGIERARGAEISPDGSVAAVRFAGVGGQPSSVVRVVDVATGATTLEVDHGAPATAAALGAGNGTLATGGVDRVVRLWSVPGGRAVGGLTGHVGQISAIAFSPHGTRVATASTDGIGRVWDVATLRPVSVLSGHKNYLGDIDFSPDGEQIVTASSDRTAITWKAKTGEELATYAGSTEAVTSAAFLPSGFGIVTSGLDGTVRTWDAVIQPTLPVVADLGAPVERLAFTRGGGRLSAVAGGRSYVVRLPKGPATDTGPAPRPSAVVAGPGGERARIDGKVVVITHPSGTTVRLVGHAAGVTSVAFSTDGRRIVTASRDHDAAVWDAATGGRLAVLRGHFALVSDARFSPDGRWIVTAGPMTAGLWPAGGGPYVYFLKGHEGRLLSVAFSPDADQVATGGEDGTIRLWTCAICGGIDHLVALANRRLAVTGRAPTDAERARYGL